MAKNLVYIGIIVLAVIAVVLGYKIYEQQTALRTPPTTQQPNIRTTPKASPLPQLQQSSAAEIAEVLKFPGANATESEIRQHGELVDKLSIRTSVLDVTNCNPNPVVFETDEGTTFKVRNAGLVAVELVRGDKIVTVPANSEKDVKVTDLAKEQAGNIGYSCMGQQGPIGVIQIVAKGS